MKTTGKAGMAEEKSGQAEAFKAYALFSDWFANGRKIPVEEIAALQNSRPILPVESVTEQAGCRQRRLDLAAHKFSFNLGPAGYRFSYLTSKRKPAFTNERVFLSTGEVYLSRPEEGGKSVMRLELRRNGDKVIGKIRVRRAAGALAPDRKAGRPVQPYVKEEGYFAVSG